MMMSCDPDAEPISLVKSEHIKHIKVVYLSNESFSYGQGEILEWLNKSCHKGKYHHISSVIP